MNQNVKVFTLPPQEEIMRRLLALHDDHPSRHVYLIIAKLGGQEVSGVGILIAYMSAIQNLSPSYQPMIISMLIKMVPGWIKAIVDDSEVVQQAISFYEEACNTQQTA